MNASLLFVGIISTVCAFAWYYIRIVAPYSKFPSYRMDARIIYWFLKGESVKINFIRDLLKISRQHAKEGMTVLWLGTPAVLVYGPEAVKTFLNEPEAVDRPRTYEVFRHFLGNAMLISSGDQWRKLKKVMHPMFQLVSLKDKVPAINEHSRQLVKILSDLSNDTTEQTLRMLKDSTFRIFMESSMGIMSNSTVSLDYHRISEMVETLFAFSADRILKPWMYLDFVLNIFPSTREKMKMAEEGQDIIRKIIEEMKRSLLTTHKLSADTFGQKPKFLSEILMKEHLKDPSFTMEDLRDLALNMILAAHDTTAMTIMYTFYLLGVHQEIQEQAYQEVISVVKNEDVRFDELQDLKYLECVIKETQRMFPVVPIVGRYLEKDVQCGEYRVPKGSTLFINIQALHNNPEVFPDPDTFDPERFRTKTSRNFVPFAEGVRACPGKAYSIIKMKIIISHVLRNFKVVSLDRREDFELMYDLALQTSKPLRMQFLSRHALTTTY